MLGTVVGFIIARSTWTARKPPLTKTIMREMSGMEIRSLIFNGIANDKIVHFYLGSTSPFEVVAFSIARLLVGT